MISVLTSQTSPRLEYVLEFIFNEVFQEPYQILHRWEDGDANSSLVLDIGNICGTKTLQVPKYSIPAHTLLFEKSVEKQHLNVEYDENQLPYFFGFLKTDGYDFPFDIFSLVFYLISRYEEYNLSKTDRFGRFPASESFAYQYQCLDQPLVDQWLYYLADDIKQKTGYSLMKNETFAVYPTIDVDKVWAYAYSGISSWKGWLKDIVLGRFSGIQDRMKSLKHPEKDPFFTFEILHKHLGKSKRAPVYFILFAKKPGGFDSNHSRQLTPFTVWLLDYFSSKNIGIHPSWASNANLRILQEEKTALSNLFNKDIVVSRQHFIKLSFPQTFQRLIDTGIKEDYSLGYPDALGYRASTGHSFYWFDLTKNEKTTLRLHPFQIMDVTMKKYEGLHPDLALEACKKMIAEAKKTNTPVRFIWHNSSFYPIYGWKNWEKVFSFLCQSENLA